MFIEDIDRKTVYNTQCELDVFDQAQADKLSSHRSYDHKIELTSDVTSSCCRAY